MQQQWINDLNNPDSQVRRDAVIALGKSKDREALKYLEAVYRTDRDPAIRELARKAGRYIRDHTDPIPEPDEIVPALPPARAEAASASPSVPERKASASDRERAKGYLDQALEWSVRHQDAKALQALAKAFTLDPELSHDTMARNLAVELTGMAPHDAIEHLEQSGARRAIVETRPTESGARAVLWDDKLKRGEAASGADDEWGPALIDLGIYGLVNGAITFVVMLVAFPAFVNFIESMMATAGRGSFPPGALAVMPTAAGLPLALLYGLISGVGAIISLVVLDFAVNLVATTVMGGAGGLARLIRKTTLFYTLLIPVSTVLSFVPFLGFANEDLLPVLTYLPMVVSLVTAIWAGKLTGDAYDFGTAKGCASIFLGGVLVTVVIACCVFTLSFALAQTLQNALALIGPGW